MTKKIGSALAFLILILSEQTVAAGNSSSWYSGLKVGWSNYYHTDIYNNISSNNDTPFHMHRNHFSGGALVGYNTNDWLSVEAGYDWLGNTTITRPNSPKTRMLNQGIQLVVKLKHSINKNIDLYARGGSMWWHQKITHDGYRGSDDGLSPLSALGTDLFIDNNWSMRLEYQYTANIGQGDNNRIITDNGLASLAMLYHFGKVPSVIPTVAKPIPIEPPQQRKIFNLQSDILFDHGSALLTEKGRESIVQLYNQLRTTDAKNPHIMIIGYTDRTGSAAYNLTLSTRRAQAVAHVLEGEGVLTSSIDIRGMSAKESVTDGQCDSINQRQAMINCLAPDRRVILDVSYDVPTRLSHPVSTDL